MGTCFANFLHCFDSVVSQKHSAVFTKGITTFLIFNEMSATEIGVTGRQDSGASPVICRSPKVSSSSIFCLRQISYLFGLSPFLMASKKTWLSLKEYLSDTRWFLALEVFGQFLCLIVLANVCGAQLRLGVFFFDYQLPHILNVG